MGPRQDVETRRNYIDGQWVPSSGGRLDTSVNPANCNELVGFVQNSKRADVDAAVAAARRASQAWKALSGGARGDYLHRVAEVLARRMEEVAAIVTREVGKTLGEARAEIARAVAILRYYAGEGVRDIGSTIPTANGSGLLFTTRVPLGTVGLITPWNFPVAIPIWKIAPAIVYGNTVVLKPAQDAAVTASYLLECMHEARLPDGVVNMVTGEGAVVGQAIVDHPEVGAISFTGSNEVGRAVILCASARGAKVQVEMGGKNPVIVAEDADLDRAVDATVDAGLRSAGQKCTATSRVIVVASVYEAFRSKLLARVRELKLGDGARDDTWMGPCASEGQMQAVLGFIATGIREGATLAHGGTRAMAQDLSNGYFVEPTIFVDVSPSMTIAQEEIFGPVLALIKVPDLSEAFAVANDVRFGLCASIFTRDIGNMLAFIDEVDAGVLRINCETAGIDFQAPFGGMKESGSHAREQGRAAQEFYTAIKTVQIAS